MKHSLACDCVTEMQCCMMKEESRYPVLDRAPSIVPPSPLPVPHISGTAPCPSGTIWSCLEQSITQTMNSLLLFRGRAASILSASPSTIYRPNWFRAQTLAPAATRKYHDSAAMDTDYASIPTPPACYADFCLIPVSHGPPLRSS